MRSPWCWQNLIAVFGFRFLVPAKFFIQTLPVQLGVAQAEWMGLISIPLEFLTFI